MSDIVIKVENIWKEYRLGVVNHHSMAKDLQSWWARVRGKEDPNAPVGSTSGKRSNSSPTPDPGLPTTSSFSLRCCVAARKLPASQLNLIVKS